MALNSCKIWSNGIKAAFFPKTLQKIVQRLGTSLPDPHSRMGYIWVPKFTRRVPRFKHFCYLTLILSPLSLAKSWFRAKTRPRRLIFHHTILLSTKAFLLKISDNVIACDWWFGPSPYQKSWLRLWVVILINSTACVVRVSSAVVVCRASTILRRHCCDAPLIYLCQLCVFNHFSTVTSSKIQAVYCYCIWYKLSKISIEFQRIRVVSYARLFLAITRIYERKYAWYCFQCKCKNRQNACSLMIRVILRAIKRNR